MYIVLFIYYTLCLVCIYYYVNYMEINIITSTLHLDFSIVNISHNYYNSVLRNYFIQICMIFHPKILICIGKKGHLPTFPQSHYQLTK